MTLPLDSVVIQHGFINPYCRILNLLDPDPVMWRILTPLRQTPARLNLNHLPSRTMAYSPLFAHPRVADCAFILRGAWLVARLYCAAHYDACVKRANCMDVVRVKINKPGP